MGRGGRGGGGGVRREGGEKKMGCGGSDNCNCNAILYII